MEPLEKLLDFLNTLNLLSLQLGFLLKDSFELVNLEDELNLDRIIFIWDSNTKKYVAFPCDVDLDKGLTPEELQRYLERDIE